MQAANIAEVVAAAVEFAAADFAFDADVAVVHNVDWQRICDANLSHEVECDVRRHRRSCNCDESSIA